MFGARVQQRLVRQHAATRLVLRALLVVHNHDSVSETLSQPANDPRMNARVARHGTQTKGTTRMRTKLSAHRGMGNGASRDAAQWQAAENAEASGRTCHSSACRCLILSASDRPCAKTNRTQQRDDVVLSGKASSLDERTMLDEEGSRAISQALKWAPGVGARAPQSAAACRLHTHPTSRSTDTQ